jgi:glycerol uptake facilitator-like aquaporin
MNAMFKRLTGEFLGTFGLVSLSPAIIAGYYQSLWIYILGPVSGAIAGSFVFAIFKEDYVEMDQTTNNFVNSSFINGQGDKIF